MTLRQPTIAQAVLIAASLLMPRLVTAQSSGLTARYCSTQNTAGNYVGLSDTYQSAGNCRTQCESSYAFAVLQKDKCWCSNYIPRDTVSTNSCNSPCPGYPDDRCGNADAGLYGYIALNIAPSGTAGAQPASSTRPSTESSSTIQSSSTPQLQSSPVSQAISPTALQDLDKTTTVSILTLTSSTSSTSTSSSTSSAPTETPTISEPPSAAVTSVQVVTVSGAVVYKTVTSTPIPAPAQDAAIERIQQQGLSGGAIAGIVIGVLVGVAAILLAAFLLWRRRKYRNSEEMTNEKGGRSPRRNVSVLSRSGLVSRGTHDANNERDFDEPINAGYNSQRHSMLFGAAAASEGVSPASVLETSNSGDSRRHSKPMVYDQRLNPSALFATHDNGSRTSMQDGADYSRTLGVTNPDPRASFDSRVSTA